MSERPRLVAMMPVRNEADRYLEEVLSDLSTYVDAIVVLDDASTDHTPEICKSYSKVVYHALEASLFFGHESELRARLWEHTIALQPQWVLAIDADEVFEERMRYEIHALIHHDEFDAVEFRLFDFWGGKTHYRVDGAWDPWTKRVRMLFRHRPERAYTWPEQRFHCPRIPFEVRGSIQVYQSDLRVMHFGWARPEDIARKYQQYKAFDDSPHLKSVLDEPEKIRLEPWILGKVLPF